MFSMKKSCCLLLVLVVFTTLLLAVDEQKKDETKMTDLTAKKVNVALKTNQGTIELELWPDIAPKTVENFVKLSKEGFYEKTYFHRVIPDFMIQGGDPNTKDNDRSNDGMGGPGYKFEDECYAAGGEAMTGKIKDVDTANIIWTEVVMPYLQKNSTPDSALTAVLDKCNAAKSWDPFMEKTVEFYAKVTGYEGQVKSKILKHPVDYGTLCMANSGPNTNGSQFFIVTKRDGASWLNGKHTVFGKVINGMDIVHKIEALPRDDKDNPKADNQAIVQKVTVKK